MSNQELQMKNIMIASPCTVDWNTMEGNERVRVCAACKHNVYDTSKLTSREILELMAKDSSACLKIYRRSDGTMLTEDCPVGLRTLRRGARKITKVAASLWALALSFISVSAQPSGIAKSDETPANTIVPRQAKTKKSKASTSKMKDDAATPSKASLMKEAGVPTVSPKDTVVSDLLFKARSNIASKNYTKAEQNFKDATSALNKSKHDIAFEKQVWSEYSDFLISRDRKTETAVIATKLKHLEEKQKKNKELDSWVVCL